MLPVRIHNDNYNQLQKEAASENRSATAQLNHILEQRYTKVTLADIASPNPSPKAQKVVDRAIKQSIEDQEKVSRVNPLVDDLIKAPEKRTKGDVLADIRAMEARRDEELRYNQDPEETPKLVNKWKVIIQSLWDEFHALKEAE